MLDLSATNLHEEIRLAEGFRDIHLSKTKELIDRYTGEAYRDDNRSGWSENFSYEFIRTTTARVIFDNPRVRVKSRQPGLQGLIAQAMQTGLNRWVRDVNLRNTLKRVYINMCFGFGVVQTVNTEQGWMDPRTRTNAFWPECHCLDMDRFFFDPLAQSFGAARYAGHKFLRDKEDVIEEAKDNGDLGWNLDALHAVSENSGIERMERDDRKYSSDRKEIVLYEVWVPEDHLRDPEDGYNGTIYTIAVGYNDLQEKKEDAGWEYVREPRAFYGPKTGPYTMFGVYNVPNDPWPLAPLVATYQQQRELNEVTQATQKAIKEYRRWVATDASVPNVAKMFKDAEDHFVYPIKGFKKENYVQMETGGLSTQHEAFMGLARGRLDRNAGQSDTSRGQVGTGSTATEIAVAEQAMQDNLSQIKQEFTDSTARMLNGAAWYLYHDDRVMFPVGGENIDPMQTGMPMVEPMFVGGEHWNGSGARYEDLELEIEPYSMERVNEQLARAQFLETLNTMATIAPMIPQTPWINWKKLFERFGDVNNDASLGDLVNVDLAMMFMGMPGAPLQGSQPAQFSKQDGGGPQRSLPGGQTGGMLAGQQGGNSGP